jgi:hypothetical protein
MDFRVLSERVLGEINMSTRSTSFEPNLGQKVNEASTEAKDKASDLGRSAASKLEEKRKAAAEGIEQTASDLQGIMKRNPAPVVLAAGVVGFLAGCAITKRQVKRRRSVQNAKAALIAAAATHFKDIVGVLFPRLQDLSQRAAQKAKAAI